MGLIQRLVGPLLGRRSLEDPRTSLSNPDEWLFDAIGGGPTLSGVRVNQKASLGIAAVWRAVCLISRDVGKVPLHVLRADGDGWERDKDHPAWYLLRHEANGEQSAFDFRALLTVHALLRGRGLAYIDRDRRGDPVQLIPLDPELTHPVRVNGVLYYVHQRRGASEYERKIPAADVLHIKGPGGDGIDGYSVLEYHRQTLGLSIAGRDYAARFFGGGGRPASVLEHPATLKPEVAKRLRESWERMYTGVENAHKTAILEEGMKLSAFGINARDAQLIESRKFDRTDIANIFGVPPHKVGAEGRTAFASLEQENQAYLDEGLDPWLVTWENECFRKLLSEEQKHGDTHRVEFLRQALVRADITARTGAYRAATGGAPWMTIDEVRAREGLRPLNTEQTSQLVMPLNMKAGASGDEPESGSSEKSGGPPPAPSQPAAPNASQGEDQERAARERVRSTAHRALLTDAAGRMTRRLGTQARRAAKNPKTFERFLARLEPEHREHVLEALRNPIMAIVGDEEQAREQGLTATAWLFDAVRRRLDEVYSAEPKSRFAEAIDKAAADLETTLPAAIAAKYGGES